MKVLFLNNNEFSPRGWFTSVKYIGPLFESFDRLNIGHDYSSVENLSELEDAIKNKEFDMVMPNMYNIRDGENILWVPKLLEDLGASVVGPGSETLNNLLNKEVTQKILQENGVNVPNFASINETNIDNIEETLKENNVSLPVIVKPANSSASEGLSNRSVRDDYKGITEQARYIMDNFEGKAQVEEYIDGQEITVGILKNGTKLATFHTYSDNPRCLTYEQGQELDYDVAMSVIKEKKLVEKLNKLAVNVFDVLNINDINRFDCMLDDNEEPFVIDVNGMPGLARNPSYFTRQIYRTYPENSEQKNYDSLIGTILYFAAQRNGIKNHGLEEKNLLPLREINNN